MGGQILKSDPPSQSEIIERTALRKEETKNIEGTETKESTGIKNEERKIQGMTLNLPRKTSLG